MRRCGTHKNDENHLWIIMKFSRSYLKKTFAFELAS